jgi:transcriptional regulator with GAF, ATPase, and Fis domain
MSTDETAEGFDALLAKLGARLLAAPSDSFDSLISDTLGQLIECMGVERATLAELQADGISARVTHAVALRHLTAFPRELLSSDAVPWIWKRVAHERTPLAISRLADLPPEATADAEVYRRFGVRAVAISPILAGDRVLGSISFGLTTREHVWSELTLARIALVSEVLAGAFLRREHERELHATLAEVTALREQLAAENEYLRERAFQAEGFENIVGESSALRSVLFQAEQVAHTDTMVLLLGETGTGKELVAKAIHARSGRRSRALVTVNCAALPPTLIESELFGHEKGAFTGATARKIGRFELADRSTLFLDEVGELPLALQTKLLRALQEGEFERVGSATTQRIDVRIIAATNRDLAAAVREGTFRSDLYYRLRVFPIELPPLRARNEDIPLLVWYFLGQLGGTLGKKIERVPAPTMERLVKYGWPGNIRELRNVLERAVILSSGPVLMLEELGEKVGTTEGVSPAVGGGVRTLEALEREHILRVLEACGGRVRGAGNTASQLGLNASTLYSRMKKLGIRRADSSPRR